MVDRFVPRILLPFTAASPRRVGARSGSRAREAPTAMYAAEKRIRKGLATLWRYALHTDEGTWAAGPTGGNA